MAVALRSPPGRRSGLVVEVRIEAFQADRIGYQVADTGLAIGVDTSVAVAGCEPHAERQAGDIVGAVATARRGFVQCHLLGRSAAEDPSMVAVAYDAVERRGASLGVAAAAAVVAHKLGTAATEMSCSLADAADCRRVAADVALVDLLCWSAFGREKAHESGTEGCRGMKVCLLNGVVRHGVSQAAVPDFRGSA